MNFKNKFRTYGVAIFIFLFLTTCIHTSKVQAFSLGDIAKKATDTVKKGAKDVEKEAKKAKDSVEKGAKEVGKLGKDALKTLSNLGFPTDPTKLLELAFSKMPDKQLKGFASKIMNCMLNQFSDLAKVAQTIMAPINALVSPIPLIPSTDAVSNFVMAVSLTKYHLHIFAFMRAFHTVTNNRYLDAYDKNKIASYEDFEKRKGVIGQNVDLNKFRDISQAITQGMKQFIDPIQKLVKQLEDAASPLLKPLEALGREFKPIPIAPLITGGALYNRAVFICNIKQIEGLFNDAKLTLENGLKPTQIDKSRYTSLIDWQKDPMAKGFMTILNKTLAPYNRTLERLDEMFIDPIGELPWVTLSVLSLVILVVSTSAKVAGFIIKEVTGETVTVAGTAVTGGSGGPALEVVTQALTSLINEDFITEFITETFYWSWIRLLQRQINHVNDLIHRAQTDGVSFDSDRFKTEFNKIIQYKSDQSSQSSSSTSSTKKISQQAASQSGDKQKKSGKKKKDKSQAGSSKKTKKVKESTQTPTLSPAGQVSVTTSIAPLSVATSQIQPLPQAALVPIATPAVFTQSQQTSSEDNDSSDDFGLTDDDFGMEADDDFEISTD